MEETSNSKLKLISIGVVILLIFIAIGGYFIFKPKNLTTELEWSEFGGSSINAKAVCSFDKEILVGQNSQLQINLTIFENLGNSGFVSNVSDPLSIVGENINWTGNLDAGDSLVLFLNVTALKTGYCEIGLRLYHDIGLYPVGSIEIIYLEISETKMILNSKFENKWLHPTSGLALFGSANNENLTSNISLSAIPYMNQEVLLTYTFRSTVDMVDAGRTYLFITFPPYGFDIKDVNFPDGGTRYHSSGDSGIEYSWKGEIRKNETYEITARFKINKEGEGIITTTVWAALQDGIEDSITDTNFAKLYVDKYSAKYEIVYSPWYPPATP